MASAGSIFVDLLLKDQNYVAGLNRARQNTRGFSGQVQGDLNKTRNAFAGVLSPVNNLSSAVGQLAGITASALSVQQIVRYSDTWKQLEGRLGLVVGEMQSITAIQSELSAIAERTRQPLEGVYNLYTRIAQAIPEAERAQFDLLGVTESINAALAVTGEGSAQAASAILQFSQALQSDFKASGQEINALLDSAPRLAQAIQRSFGDGSKSLKELAKDGELSRDVILRALSGIGAEGIKLREELSRLPPTVGQAFTQLDNAFLQFIGNSEAANAGASSLGLAVKSLADNLDIVTNGVVVLSTVMVARLIPSVISVASGFAASSATSFAYQSSLIRLNSVQASHITLNNATRLSAINAATGVTSLATATNLGTASLIGFTAAGRSAGLLMAALGGPIGIALIAVVTALTLHTNEAVEAEQRYNKIISDTTNSFVGYSDASSEAKEQILEDAQARITAMNNELKKLEQLVLGYASLNQGNILDALGVGVLEGLGKLGIGTSPSEVLAQYEAAQEALRQLQAERDRALNPTPYTPSGSGPSDKDKKAAAKLEKELGSLYDQNRKYILGLNDATLRYNDTIAELDLLLGAGKITQDQYSDALLRVQEEFDKSSEKAKVWSFNIEDAAEQASKNIQSTFADFLFDPFEDGLSGMLEGFANTLRRMAAEAASAQILASIFGEGGFSFGSAAQSAPSKSIFSGLFDGFFADGGTIQPGHFGIAGEAGAELVYGGMSGATVIPQGGGGVSINIINNNNSSVTQSSQKTANGTDITVMIDQAVAANIGTPGTKTNQALGAFTNRSLVRR